MNLRTACAVLVASATLLGCNKPEATQPAPTVAVAPAALPAAATSSSGRAITDAARATMKRELTAEPTGRKAWIYSQPGNPEVAAVVTSLQAVFQEAGWEVGAETASGISLKPGVVTLVAEETIPNHVKAVLKALDASGLEAKSASGYRSYFQEMKTKNPNWPGVPLRPEQDFIIVIGAKPPA
jgi:hypothetical protein